MHAYVNTYNVPGPAGFKIIVCFFGSTNTLILQYVPWIAEDGDLWIFVFLLFEVEDGGGS